MLRLVRLPVVFALCAIPGLGAPIAAAQGDSPVRVHVDIHVPLEVPAVAVPVSSEPPPRYRGHHEEAPPAEWSEHQPGRGHSFSVPPDRVPGGGWCRIWYDDLPPDRQPPPMSCPRAHDIARRHGGRVIWADSRHAHHDGRVASASYGRVDFSGVPPDRLPPPGTCRVWFDGVPPDRQPPPGPCGHVEREARRTGGRLLYMPGP